ncbi:hypothetical protein C8F01DRAFT_1376385 [Mycena amicta]|nr:hypothetical protein C8F01DRAFT_1376385 [Mycena amicta]
MDTTTTELAVEIIDAILSHLVDGSPTVRACRLVCRIWHSLSCYRHSKTTTLLVTGDQVPLLLGLLQSPNCTIHGWLRGITLAAPEDGPTDLLPALLPRFSELHRLRMIGIKAASPQICEMPVLPGITSLHIEGIRMRSFACFTGLLWKLPNLRELTLDRVWYNYISLSVSPPPSDSDSEQDDDEDREYNQPQPPDSCPTCAHVDQLQRVSLDTFKLDLTSIVSTGYRDRELLDWLSSEATAPIVTHFRVYPKALEPRGILKFMQYLDHIGDSLQSLHVVFHSKAYLERLNFNHYRSLTTLRIAFLSAFHYWGLFSSRTSSRTSCPRPCSVQHPPHTRLRRPSGCENLSQTPPERP